MRLRILRLVLSPAEEEVVVEPEPPDGGLGGFELNDITPTPTVVINSNSTDKRSLFKLCSLLAKCM